MPPLFFLQIITLLITLLIAGGLAYQYLLLIAGKPGAKAEAPVRTAPPLRFAIAIPAHNEAGVIGATVRRLRQMDYPADRFDVHVVADHCSDDTAAVARGSRRDRPRARRRAGRPQGLCGGLADRAALGRPAALRRDRDLRRRQPGRSRLPVGRQRSLAAAPRWSRAGT